MNRQYDEMLSAAIARLRSIDLAAAAEAAGMRCDPPQLTFTSFGQPVALDIADLHAEPAIDMWHHLALLQYLEGAGSATPDGRWIGLSDLPGGMIRGASFDREIDARAASGLSGCGEEVLREAIRQLGGHIKAGGAADLCAVFSFAPRYPLRLNLWLSDDEFPASAKVLLDAGASPALGVEAAGTVAAMLINKLIERTAMKGRSI